MIEGPVSSMRNPWIVCLCSQPLRNTRARSNNSSRRIGIHHKNQRSGTGAYVHMSKLVPDATLSSSVIRVRIWVRFELFSRLNTEEDSCLPTITFMSLFTESVAQLIMRRNNIIPSATMSILVVITLGRYKACTRRSKVTSPDVMS